MADCFIGEIRIFGGSYAPYEWAFCDGQLMSIAQNDSLFSLIGVTYGGDGYNNFALPDLRGRVPMHRGNDNYLGQKAGGETVAMEPNQVASHRHTVRASAARGTQNTPEGNVWAVAAAPRYTANTPGLAMKSSSVGGGGGGLAHDNMMPFLVLNFIISLAGIFPTQS
jgi:microcystin-dependent protein